MHHLAPPAARNPIYPARCGLAAEAPLTCFIPSGTRHRCAGALCDALPERASEHPNISRCLPCLLRSQRPDVKGNAFVGVKMREIRPDVCNLVR